MSTTHPSPGDHSQGKFSPPQPPFSPTSQAFPPGDTAGAPDLRPLDLTVKDREEEATNPSNDVEEDDEEQIKVSFKCSNQQSECGADPDSGTAAGGGCFFYARPSSFAMPLLFHVAETAR
eukprot:GABV01008906.1.p1 GENE.GABV01008906.1~~GABV01008906.1.p1  ORF type:complete len:120 (+),score=30.66 GABV01008906.1:511-870(+)